MLGQKERGKVKLSQHHGSFKRGKESWGGRLQVESNKLGLIINTAGTSVGQRRGRGFFIFRKQIFPSSLIPNSDPSVLKRGRKVPILKKVKKRIRQSSNVVAITNKDGALSWDHRSCWGRGGSCKERKARTHTQGWRKMTTEQRIETLSKKMLRSMAIDQSTCLCIVPLKGAWVLSEALEQVRIWHVNKCVGAVLIKDKHLHTHHLQDTVSPPQPGFLPNLAPASRCNGRFSADKRILRSLQALI